LAVFKVARCLVARLMGETGLQGSVRAQRKRTTISDTAAPRPRDRADRDVEVG